MYYNPLVLEQTRFEDQKIICNQIKEYIEFHENIKKYFETGNNIFENNNKEKLYFIDLDWINKWKKYVNYNIVKNNINHYLNNNNDLHLNNYLFPHFIKSGNSLDLFLGESLLKIQNFDCVVNTKNFDLFCKLFKILKHTIFINKIESIEAIFYYGLLTLLIKKQLIIKILFKNSLEDKKDLSQFNIDFLGDNDIQNNNSKIIDIDDINVYCNEDNNKKRKFSLKILKNLKIHSLTKKIINNIILKIDHNKSKENYEIFKAKFIENNNLLNLFNFINEIKKDNNFSKIIIKKNKEFFCYVYCNNIINKNFEIEQKNKIKNISINNIDHSRIIGLQNIGATCYMNSTI